MSYVWEQDASTTGPKDKLRSLEETSFEQAQLETNFIVFIPKWLPKDSQLTDITLRPEQAPGRPEGTEPSEYGLTPWSQANPSSVRAVIRGRNRRLRIKQFLYDWAVPAASTAPLWKSAQLHPFTCQDAIAWLGNDYMGRQGACVQLKRTQIEISVENGEFTSDELKNILKGLTVANPVVSSMIRRIPFHRLNYFVRYRVVGPDVPYGLWKYHHARRYSHSQSISQVELSSASPVPIPTLIHPDFFFDSAAVIEKPEEQHRELEIIYRHRENYSDYLWIVVMNEDSDIALPSAPLPEEHPAEIRRKEKLRGTTVYYAALTEKYGAWEALWHEGESAVAVWGSASQYINGGSFKRIVNKLKLG